MRPSPTTRRKSKGGREHGRQKTTTGPSLSKARTAIGGGPPRFRHGHGCIIFSQYYDTAYWIASELAKTLPNEPVAVYAGTGRSGMFRAEEFASIERDEIKHAVKRRDIRLVVATDAACEGLNLQTLGTLINVDLPWNPSRLEQRLGRIKRFGHPHPHPLTPYGSQLVQSIEPNTNPMVFPNNEESPDPRGTSSITPAEIYAAYPRQVARTPALRAIAKAMKKTDPAFLLSKAREYAAAVNGTDPQFIPHPATWFNAGRFNEEPEQWNAKRQTPLFRPQVSPDIAGIVALYPRREKTAEACEIVAADLAGGMDAEAIMIGTRAHAAAISMLPGGGLNAFLPTAATFFRERRWQDDPRTWERNAVKGSSGAPVVPLDLGGRRGTTIKIPSRHP